jgi:hypothetical protein
VQPLRKSSRPRSSPSTRNIKLTQEDTIGGRLRNIGGAMSKVTIALGSFIIGLHEIDVDESSL